MKFLLAILMLLFSHFNIISGWRLTYVDNLSYKEILKNPDLNFQNMRFKEKLIKKGWESIINSNSQSQSSPRTSSNSNIFSNSSLQSPSLLRQQAKLEAQNLAEDIHCLLGKCKNVKQQMKLQRESQNVLTPNNIESKRKIKDPIVEISMPHDGDEMIIGENPGNGITIKRKTVQDQIDARFIILRPYDGIINSDKSVRFYSMDTTTKESLIMKLYFKGDPKQGIFFNGMDDPGFKDSSEDCRDSKIISNRVFGKPLVYKEAIVDGKNLPVFSNFEMTRCISDASSSGPNSAFYGIYTIPQGEKLSKKCLHDLGLSKDNSCIHYLKLISNGILNGLKLLNSGNNYYKHGNIRPSNIYLYVKNDTQKIYLDNMIYDKNIYDDINDKPFKYDFNMLGETLLQLLSGTGKTENVILNMPTSTFDIYYQIRKYFLKHSIDINLKIAALNVADGIFDYLGKCVTRAEYEYKLKKSIFNFIYRLKCSGTNPTDQFMDIDQALKHDFIKSGTDSEYTSKNENWDINPSDY